MYHEPSNFNGSDHPNLSLHVRARYEPSLYLTGSGRQQIPHVREVVFSSPLRYRRHHRSYYSRSEWEGGFGPPLPSRVPVLSVKNPSRNPSSWIPRRSMGFSGPHRLDIFEIYTRYHDIVSRNDHATSKELLAMLSKSLECRGRAGEAIFNDMYKLMSCLDLSVDSRSFNCFYDFVFFFCRENGQKNITVHKAITAWRLVLNGRFRLLNQWCDFVQEHQRHNISEDTWQQLLAFSRCVNEDLEGYDPKGAWPVLIDDFVEHMYRTSRSKSCSTQDFICGCADMEAQPSISNTFSGLNLLPGSKRKSPADTDEHCKEESRALENPTSSDHVMEPKRVKRTFVDRPWESELAMSTIDGTVDYHAEMNKHGSLGCLQTSACAVEDSLSKGFEGYLSIECCFQFDQQSRV